MEQEIRIYLTNLGKYNEGYLIGEWITLPISDDELAESFERIGINEHYEEYFITDYEAPFEIGEYTNLESLNNLACELEDIEEYELLEQYFEEYPDDRLYDMDELDEILYEFTPMDIVRMVHFGDFNFNDDYFTFDGYGNLESVSSYSADKHNDYIIKDQLNNLVNEYI
ncbi:MULTISPECIES: antirestriction protein ArdA [Aerococcus]|uniref:Antirestriction protein ArdA n=1 Tax=Aerococcus mictus TaxID=2976810 RepID=A0A1E9PPH3_9LACT|nr:MULTISPECIES: antirestriction protein ArdA [Aerococcus]KAA9290010.1 antirestriction protein ArdA [Aerococcus mictus]MBU5611229.1 antirestriction protein ArdA [Aerococcus urinae]MCY3064964.1 antirestriction protein ArdA [Aerococcus mictus]MCY3076215.1 antirestriction protein ArdA [Aerococcus mictus]MCY3081412.1 antirestriction protein ArdA [Aerococcus mictus]